MNSEEELDYLHNKLDHTNEWLDRFAQAREAIPEVWIIRDTLRWQYDALNNAPAEAPSSDAPVFVASFEEDWQSFTKALPMLPAVDPGLIADTTAASVGSTTVSYDYVLQLGRIDNPVVKAYSQEYVSRYQALQQAKERETRVRTFLEDPRILERFERARNAYYAAKTNTGEITSAALELRTFIDGIQKILFDRARNKPKENMTWEKMSARLTEAAPAKISENELLRQKQVRTSMIQRLSEIAKDRTRTTPSELDALWTELLDHTFVVLGLSHKGRG